MSRKEMPTNLAGTGGPRVETVFRSTIDSGPTAKEKVARRTATIRTISAFKLEPHPIQPPTRHSTINVLELAESIRELGLLEPPLIRRTIDQRYVILAGHRRCHAWRLLVAEGLVEPGLRVHVVEDISDGEALKFVAAEYFHHQEYSVLHTARLVGETHKALRAASGGQIPLRQLQAVLPLRRTSIGQYLTIYEALQDPQLAPLVHSVDNPSKLSLYKALRQPELQTRIRALQAMQPRSEGSGRAAENATRRGRPSKRAKRQKRGKGFDLQVEVRAKMPLGDIQRVRDALKRALDDLNGLHGSGQVEQPE